MGGYNYVCAPHKQLSKFQINAMQFVFQKEASHINIQFYGKDILQYDLK